MAWHSHPAPIGRFRLRRGLPSDAIAVMTPRHVLVTLVVLAGWFATEVPAGAQTVELGAQATYIDLGVFDRPAWGVGGRFGRELLPFVTLEAEVNVFPSPDTPMGPFVQGLGGIKLGGRGQTYGLFAKLRPGFVRFDRDFIQPGTVCVAVAPAPRECLATRTNLALDFGSVLEVYPSERLTLRVDLGTTYLWYGSRGNAGSQRYGNFQLGLGAGVRF